MKLKGPGVLVLCYPNVNSDFRRYFDLLVNSLSLFKSRAHMIHFHFAVSMWGCGVFSIDTDSIWICVCIIMLSFVLLVDLVSL